MKKSNFTILVADDDPDYLFQTISNLEKSGYRTVAVESQSEAELNLVIACPLSDSSDRPPANVAPRPPDFRRYSRAPNHPAVSHETGLSFSLDSEHEKSWIRADRYLEKGIRAEQLDQEVMKLLKL